MAEDDADKIPDNTDEGNTEEAAEHAEVPLDEDLGGGTEGDEDEVEDALRAWEAGGHLIEDDPGDEIMPVQFAQLEPPPPLTTKPNINRLNNVMVDVIVEVGRKEMLVSQLLNLKEQDVIDLDKLTGEHFDILINKKPFAEGEIVVVSDSMAVRITKIYDVNTIDDTPTE